MSTLNKLLYKVYKSQWIVTRPITLSVCLLLIKEDQILLVRPSYQDGWFLLGGGVKRHETLEQAARREAGEEIGGTLGPLQLVGLYTRFADFKSDHIALLKCSDFTYTGHHDFEIEEIALFPFEELPVGVNPSHARQIREHLLNGKPGPDYGYW